MSPPQAANKVKKLHTSATTEVSCSVASDSGALDAAVVAVEVEAAGTALLSVTVVELEGSVDVAGAPNEHIARRDKRANESSRIARRAKERRISRSRSTTTVGERGGAKGDSWRSLPMGFTRRTENEVNALS